MDLQDLRPRQTEQTQTIERFARIRGIDIKVVKTLLTPIGVFFVTERNGHPVDPVICLGDMVSTSCEAIMRMYDDYPPVFDEQNNLFYQ